ncbi:MAG: hypothetical protein Q7N95_04060 [Alphaproteobacteria bacterium]|nr:hypothetical protein [Alphaproteobacteria bacterium]
MTSDRQTESNKINASRSTGPRTPGGKHRSRNNARRHGLATRIEDDAETQASIEDLTAILAEGSTDFERIDQSRLLALSHFDLRRIRSARHEVFLAVYDLENVCGDDLVKALSVMDRINRYQTRALSKSRRAQRKLADSTH